MGVARSSKIWVARAREVSGQFDDPWGVFGTLATPIRYDPNDAEFCRRLQEAIDKVEVFLLVGVDGVPDGKLMLKDLYWLGESVCECGGQRGNNHSSAARRVTINQYALSLNLARELALAGTRRTVSASPVDRSVAPKAELGMGVAMTQRSSISFPGTHDSAVENSAVRENTVAVDFPSLPVQSQEGNGANQAMTPETFDVVKVDTGKRPRPSSLDFSVARVTVDNYLTGLDESARGRERLRIKMINQLRNEWMQAKISYDASKSGIRLNSGRVVRGTIMANESRLIVLGGDGAQPATIQWDEINLEQYLLFLEDHVRQKMMRASGEMPGERNCLPDVGNDCFRLAILFDWYNRSASAATYAKHAVRCNPSLQAAVNGYLPGALQ